MFADLNRIVLLSGTCVFRGYARRQLFCVRLFGCFSYLPDSFHSLFGRRLESTCEIYLVATDEQQQQHKQQRLARSASLCGDALVGSISVADTESMVDLDPMTVMHIPACARAHLQECVAISRQESICDFVNLMQNPARMKPGRRQVAPTLLRGSLLWSLRHARLLSPVEYLAVQGIPSNSLDYRMSRGSSADEQAMEIPFTVDLSECMSESTVRQMAGNAMHVQQVGATFVLVFALLAELRREDIKQ